MAMIPPLNLMKWIGDNAESFKPPVGNKKIWHDSQFDVFIVGGPNKRKDYHMQAREEFFYQLKGDMTLKVVEDGEHRDIVIKEGEIFLLPPWVPHSPQRPADTLGLVIEYARSDDEEDGLRWYCEGCNNILHEESFHLVDIVGELKTAIGNFMANEDLRTCNECGTMLMPPQ